VSQEGPLLFISFYPRTPSIAPAHTIDMWKMGPRKKKRYVENGGFARERESTIGPGSCARVEVVWREIETTDFIGQETAIKGMQERKINTTFTQAHQNQSRATHQLIAINNKGRHAPCSISYRGPHRRSMPRSMDRPAFDRRHGSHRVGRPAPSRGSVPLAASRRPQSPSLVFFFSRSPNPPPMAATLTHQCGRF
jgi:hypothetical protein